MTKTTTTTTAAAAPSFTDGIKNWTSAGMNVRHTVQNGYLILAVPVTPEAIKAARPSTSGKNVTIGSSLGNQAAILPDGGTVKFGLNVYTAKPGA